MRLLQRRGPLDYQLTRKLRKDEITRYPYAILSHTWDPNGDEVVYKDLTDGTDVAFATQPAQQKWEKIRFCGEQSGKDELQYFWVDSCCIDKSGTSELSEAINSMFQWYERAVKCYVYLWDVQCAVEAADNPQRPWLAAFRASRWFTRRWTLQELLAPRSVDFFSREGTYLGSKDSLKLELHVATGISTHALQGSSLRSFTVAERLTWAAQRNATLEEDEAYSLAGLFHVWVTPRYGEGREQALHRLLEKIRKSDHNGSGRSSSSGADYTGSASGVAIRESQGRALMSVAEHLSPRLGSRHSRVANDSIVDQHSDPVRTSCSMQASAEDSMASDGPCRAASSTSEVLVFDVSDSHDQAPSRQHIASRTILSDQHQHTSPVDIDSYPADSPSLPPWSDKARELSNLGTATGSERVVNLSGTSGDSATYFLDGQDLSDHVVMNEVNHMAGPNAQIRGGATYKQRRGYIVVGKVLDDSQCIELERWSREHQRARRTERMMIDRT